MNHYFSGKHCLVTGATGFVGANLVARLLSERAKVRGTLHRKKAVIEDSRIEYVQADLMHLEDCKKAVDGIDFVFMCSANTAGAAVMTSTPLVHVTPNLIMNSQLLEAAYYAKVKKFIFISSSAGYPPSDDRYVEEDEFFVGDPYETYYPVGWMKRYTEILCRTYGQKLKNPMHTVVIRPSNIYGPYDDFDPKTSHMMASLIRRVVEKQNPFVVWGNGKDIKDMIYIDDFIEGMLLATEKLDSYTPINIASGERYDIKDIINTMLDVAGYKVDVQYDATKPSVIPIRLISPKKAEKLLGFRTKTSLREGIKKTIDWYKQNF